MKTRIMFSIVCLLMLLAAFTCAYGAINPDDDFKQVIPAERIQLIKQGNSPEGFDICTATNKIAAITLPAELQIIEDSAFEGTALTAVNIPEKVDYIGGRAFARIPTLLSIYIPESTQFIGENAFDGTKHVTITASSGSYARNWAKNNGIPFVTQVVFYASSGTVQISGYQINEGSKNKTANAETIDIPKYSEAKGRTNGEIIAAKHEECFAFSLQGRSPPMKG